MPPNAGKLSLPSVQNLIAIASGKGGVGKSTVALNLAYSLVASGARVGLLDADIYGPSIPLMVGTNEKPEATDDKVIPIEREGLKLISIGFLIPEDQPVVWRGPMVHGALTQFLTQVEWGELDYLLIDMPPGTGDVQLTICQNAPLAGAVIVTTPQNVSLLDARKGLMMFQKVQVPILGVLENMAGSVFGEGGGERLASEFSVPFLGSIPLDPEIVKSGDEGRALLLKNPKSPAVLGFHRAADLMKESLSHFPQGPASGHLSLEWQ